MDWNHCRFHSLYLHFSRPLHEGVDWNLIFLYFQSNFASSRPLHEGVDWNIKHPLFIILYPGRPLHEGVDWNLMADFSFNQILVALFTRAWIEITCNYRSIYRKLVALFTRAWIEIKWQPLFALLIIVALFTRAWIEISFSEQTINTGDSRPLHEGVDWNFDGKSNAPWPRTSPSSRGRGLKYWFSFYTLILCRSPSSRGRGLKFPCTPSSEICIASPSSRGRGLKWHRFTIAEITASRPLHEGVDWNNEAI